MGRGRLPSVSTQLFTPAAVVWLSIALSSSGCGGAFPRDAFATNTRTDDVWLEGPRCEGPVDTSGIVIEDVEPGNGKVVGDGDTVRVHFTATLKDGTVVHDTDRDTPPIELILGSSKIICGFEKGVTGTRAGGQRKITVPARLAFGSSGKPPQVPPGSDLVFLDVQIPASLSSEPRSSPARPAQGGGGGGRPGH